jgi:predicted MFS family arabinose efflux permease
LTIFTTDICCQWTAIGFKQFPAHIWVACVVFGFGFLSTMQAVVVNYQAMVVCRFFLGAVEAMYAGTPFYLSFFYPRDKVGFRQGIFLTGSALANAYGGALGYAIGNISGSIPPWKILFIIEGIPSCCAALLAFFFLPDNLPSAKFLNEREQRIAAHFIQRGQTPDLEHHRGIRFKEMLSAFADWRAYIPGLIYFSCNVSFASLPLFVPTIISEIGTFSTIQSNGLSAPPYLLCFLSILVCSFWSDRVRMRGPFVFGAGVTAAVGFILLATTTGAAPRYIGVFLSINIFVSVACLLPWITNSHATESKRGGGWAIAATFGQCGPLLGTNLFPTNEGPYYIKGSWICCAFCLLVALLSVVYSMLLARENRKWDRMYETEERGGRAPAEKGFRYIL